MDAPNVRDWQQLNYAMPWPRSTDTWPTTTTMRYS
jgi:hypothetical protein